jgi:hypothetical protein
MERLEIFFITDFACSIFQSCSDSWRLIRWNSDHPRDAERDCERIELDALMHVEGLELRKDLVATIVPSCMHTAPACAL